VVKRRTADPLTAKRLQFWKLGTAVTLAAAFKLIDEEPDRGFGFDSDFEHDDGVPSGEALTRLEAEADAALRADCERRYPNDPAAAGAAFQRTRHDRLAEAHAELCREVEHGEWLAEQRIEWERFKATEAPRIFGSTGGRGPMATEAAIARDEILVERTVAALLAKPSLWPNIMHRERDEKNAPHAVARAVKLLLEAMAKRTDEIEVSVASGRIVSVKLNVDKDYLRQTLLPRLRDRIVARLREFPEWPGNLNPP
jgi:hypothetical protein